MSETKNSQANSVVFDTSVLIEYIEDTDLGKKIFKELISNPSIERYYVPTIVDLELKYILCRRMGFQAGINTVNNLLKDFIFFNSKDLRDKTAYIKCNYAISIADSYVIASAILLDVPIYMKREQEIENVLKSISKLVEIKFINDL